MQSSSGRKTESIEEIIARKKALRRLSCGVYVVSARRGDEINAMTVRMVSQISARPPRIALSIAKRARTHNFISESGSFALNILAQGQELLGGHFGLHSGRNLNKFTALEYDTGVTGAPILREYSAFLECCLCGAHDMGTCTLFIGEVIRSGTQEREPLVYRESDYFD